MNEPMVVAFPLRGEWYSPNTPGSRVPSHGTNRFGTRYAYDFIQVDWNRKGRPAYRGSFLRYLLFGLPLAQYYCWGQEVYAPCDGVVVQVRDGVPEPRRTHLLRDLLGAYRNAHHFDLEKDGVETIAGNFVVIRCGEGVYAALVHLQTGSVQVSVGQRVGRGDLLGRVGHSGNSFAPHLHFQLMDSRDIAAANGLPCVFERYEVCRAGKWETRTKGMPTREERIRSPKTSL